MEFKEIPGQESWDGLPTFNRGWRFGVFVGSALLLLSMPLCVIGVAI